MARPKKDVKFDADDQTIIEHFDQSMELCDTQKSASSEISAHNQLMQGDGVDPGVLSICRRLARMKPGKRGTSVALLHRYLQVLASRLEDPAAAAKAEAEPMKAEAPAEAGETAPFERGGSARSAAAA